MTSKWLVLFLQAGGLLTLASCVSNGNRNTAVFTQDTASEISIPVIGQTERVCRESLGYTYPSTEILYYTTATSRVWTIMTRGRHGIVTSQFEIGDGAIRNIRVLSSKEQRGRQIKSQRFLRQFEGVSLSARNALNKRVDGITGATISSKAVNDAALLALKLDAAMPLKASD